MAGNISTETTVLSNLSVERNLSVGTLLGSPAITGGAITASSVSAGTLRVAAGAIFAKLSMVTVPVVATSVTGNKSISTTFTLSGMSTADMLFVGTPTSGLSNGITADAWVNAADTITVFYSNVSSATAAQIATTLPIIVARV